MQNHTKIYFEFFDIGYSEDGSHEFIPCSICGSKAVDIHHINGRISDNIENLIGLCRTCHNEAHAGKYTKQQLTEKQALKIKHYDKRKFM